MIAARSSVRPTHTPVETDMTIEQAIAGYAQDPELRRVPRHGSPLCTDLLS
jgi:hypothetical protein